MFKKILNYTQLHDTNVVKDYLKFSFRQRKAKKDYKLYINICKIYNVYPDTIKELLNNIPVLGYYKDYFYILSFSRNQKLDQHIYNIVSSQLKKDMEYIKNGQHNKITTMGKWIPKESSTINKKIDFVDKFNKIFYPGVSKFTARKEYRKMKTFINDTLGTLEAKLCTKKYDDINFSKVSYNALKRNEQKLLTIDVCKQKLELHIETQMKQLPIAEFIKNLLTEKIPVNIMEKTWNTTKYIEQIPYNKFLKENNFKCILDLSKDTYNHSMQHFAVGCALAFGNVHVCNEGTLKLDGDILERSKHIMRHSGPCKSVDVTNYIDPLSNNHNMLFITDKELNNIDKLNVNNTMITQFKLKNKYTYDVISYKNNIAKIEKENCLAIVSTNIKKKNMIKTIIDTSHELNITLFEKYIVHILVSAVTLFGIYIYLF